MILAPKSDPTHNIVSVKDPTRALQQRVAGVRDDGEHGGRLEPGVTHFSDFSQANSAPQYYLTTTRTSARIPPRTAAVLLRPEEQVVPGLSAGAAGVLHSGRSTRPETWSAPQELQSVLNRRSSPDKAGGGWIDFWVICDAANCYLFFSDDNGHPVSSADHVANFPSGFGNTVVVMKDTSNRFNLFEASNVYKVQGTNRTC